MLSRHATAQDIPILVKGLLDQMSQHFPGEHLAVVAFRPVLPLGEAAVARLNGETGEITYSGPDSLPR